MLPSPNSLTAHPAASLFPLLSGAELGALAADIREHGLIDPIVLICGAILDGRNRLAACELAGVEPRFREWDGTGSPTSWVISVNLQRRHLTVTQRGVVGCASLPLLAAEAKARQGERTDLQPPGNLAPKSRKATDEAAAAVGVSGRTVAKSAAIAKSAPDLYAAMRSGLVTLEQATVLAKLPEPERAPLIEDIRAAPTIEARERTAKHAAKGAKERHKANVVAEIEARPPPPATGPFRVIAIDPPWQYDKRPDDVTHRARLDYPPMTIEAICALPVAELAEEDCVLWLWTTNAHILREAPRCLDAWGFREKTILTWAKDQMGVGDWLRGQTEHCILAIRGRPVVNLTRETTLLTAPRREHSRKPEEFYALVEALCPGSKLEMFARAPRKGWASWGAETARFEA